MDLVCSSRRQSNDLVKFKSFIYNPVDGVSYVQTRYDASKYSDSYQSE